MLCTAIIADESDSEDSDDSTFGLSFNGILRIDHQSRQRL